MNEATLWQFRRSPYNEKARWALDLARVPHRRRTLLPGPHALALLRTFQTKTPVLERAGSRIIGSSAIVAAVAPELVPSDAAEREEAIRIERRFDEELTPRMRRAVLAALLADHGAWVETFAGDESPERQARYRRSLGVVERVVRWANGVGDAASIEDGSRAVGEALDLVARVGTGYLVGARLSVADVAAASALGAVLDPNHADTAYGPLGRAALAPLEARWAGHAGAAWVHRMYATHRRAR